MSHRVSGLNIDVKTKRTFHAIVVDCEKKTSEENGSITWSGNVTFQDTSNSPDYIEFPAPFVQNVIKRNNVVTLESLNTQAQDTYSKNYDVCTGVEQKAVFKLALGSQWKTSLKASPFLDMTDSVIDSVVDNIISCCCC